MALMKIINVQFNILYSGEVVLNITYKKNGLS